MTGTVARDERFQIMLTPEELQLVDDFRFKQRMPTRTAAIRELFRLGLVSHGIQAAESGKKSSSFGVPRATSGRDSGEIGYWPVLTPSGLLKP